MTPDPAELLTKAAAAVTGPDTPNSATISSGPDKGSRWMIILAGPAVSAMLCGVVYILAFWFWPDAVSWRSERLALAIVQGVAAIAISLCIMQGLVIFRLASGGLKSVTARAFGGALEIDTNDAGSG